MLRKFFLTTLVLAATAGCDNGTAPNPTTALPGPWVRVEPAGQPPGFGFQMNLSVQGQTVSGTGTWQGEAIPSGTATVTGSIDGTDVHLDLTLNAAGGGIASHEVFSGRLTSDTELVGQSTTNGSAPFSRTFKRQTSFFATAN